MFVGFVIVNGFGMVIKFVVSVVVVLVLGMLSQQQKYDFVIIHCTIESCFRCTHGNEKIK